MPSSFFDRLVRTRNLLGSYANGYSRMDNNNLQGGPIEGDHGALVGHGSNGGTTCCGTSCLHFGMSKQTTTARPPMKRSMMTNDGGGGQHRHTHCSCPGRTQGNGDKEANETEEEDDEDEEDEDGDEDEEEEEEEEGDDTDEENKEKSNHHRCPHHHHHHNQEEEAEEEEEEEEAEEDTCEHELFCCNVCDEAFSGARQLAKHQVYRQHFGCSVCDTVFPSLASLEQHKASLEHWSDDEDESDEGEEENDHDHGRHTRDEDNSVYIFQQKRAPKEIIELSCFNIKHGYPETSTVHTESVHLSLKDSTIAGRLDKQQHSPEETTTTRPDPCRPSTSGLRSSMITKCPGIALPATSTSTAKSTTGTTTLLSSSLSSKLMASVFNFSSSSSLNVEA